MIVLKKVLTFFVKLFLYSAILILIDASIIFLVCYRADTFAYVLSLTILIEGGLGLIFGSILASFSPSTVKLSEILFNSEPWNLTRQKEIEKQMRTIIITSLILVIEGLLVSAL